MELNWYSKDETLSPFWDGYLILLSIDLEAQASSLLARWDTFPPDTSGWIAVYGLGPTTATLKLT